MWAPAIAWLVGTKAGRSVALAVALLLGALLSWWAFSSHYYDQGVAACQSGRATDTNAANVAQGEQNIANNKTSAELAKEADSEAVKVVEDAEKAKSESKETVSDVYKKPPVTAPIAIGSCVHPLDDRVQDRISKARAAAAKARSP